MRTRHAGVRAARALAIGLIGAGLAWNASAQTAPDSGTVDRVLKAAVDSGFSGVVLIATGDSVVLQRAYGARGARLTPRSAFWIASMTKGFTAVAVLQLAERHRLSLHDSLSSFFADVPPDKRAITIRQLLTHTAGLADSYAGAHQADRRAAVRAILAQPLAYRPGAGYQYGDDDYELLAAIVEVTAHRSWEAVVQREILDPGGLRHTGFWCRRRSGVPLPVAGAEGARSRCGGAGNAALDDWGHRGADGMSSTAIDLLRWTRPSTLAKVLGPAGRLAFGTPQVLVRREPPDDVSYGYGLRIYTREGRVTEIMHSGSGDDGHTGVVRLLPSGLTVIVLSNAGMRGGTTWSSHVARLLVSRY
jgi:CubicO group peptidase (beta-lactamase class C family)